MRKSINAIVNVIRLGNRRNREAVVAVGVDSLRASGPGYPMPGFAMQRHALHPQAGRLGHERPRGGLLSLLDQRSSLDASSAWWSLPLSAGKREASQVRAGLCFTTATHTATTKRPQASGRFEQRAAIAAARLLASA